MPVNQKKMKSMKKQYGKKKGEQVYYAVENKARKKKKGNKRQNLRQKA